MQDSLNELRSRLAPVPEGHCLIGLSGGADSVALLYMLSPLVREGRLRLEAVHVNHGLRGAASDGDERFAKELCERTGVPFHAYRIELEDRRDENSAREARYECFRRCADETGAATIILAHHRDDQAETFMMRLLRGAGPEGLGCMKPDEERQGLRILRPMLDITRTEIRQALTEKGICLREDESNKENRYLRNFIRNRLIPQMEEASPGASGRIARCAGLIALENEEAEKNTEVFIRRNATGSAIRTKPLQELSEGEKRRTVRQWWRRYGPELDERELSYDQTLRLVRLAEAKDGETVNLPAGYRARRGRDHIHLIPPGRKIPENAAIGPEGAELCGITLKILPGGNDPGNGIRCQEVPKGFTNGCVLRTRRPGDMIRPFGMKGTKKLQDYLTDRGVDMPWRDRIPLLCRGNEVLLAAGIGAGNVPAWEPGKEHDRLVWTGEMPWEKKRS